MAVFFLNRVGLLVKFGYGGPIPFFLRTCPEEAKDLALKQGVVMIGEKLTAAQCAACMPEVLSEWMANAEGVDEAMKRRDQLGYVQRMNSIRNRAEEIVESEVVFA